MKDIAEELGISLMTVSKALRNHADIAASTRRRVMQRARELGYEPNLVARSLANSQTYLVGLVIPDMMHSFFAEVAKGVSEKLEPHGYQVLICNSREDAEAEFRQIRMLLSRNVDGLIIASAALSKKHSPLDLLKARNTRYVLVDRQLRNSEANYVGVRDEKISALAVDHLLQQGCRRIAHISGPMVATGRGRLQGYHRAVAAHGLEVRREYVVSGTGIENGGYAAMKRLLRVTPRPDGVFCYNDPIAVGAVQAVLDAGLRVPNDVAIIGAGDVNYASLLRVPLSTINQNSMAIGETAAELLLECMQAKSQPAPRRVFLDARLVVRESTLRR